MQFVKDALFDSCSTEQREHEFEKEGGPPHSTEISLSPMSSSLSQSVKQTQHNNSMDAEEENNHYRNAGQNCVSVTHRILYMN